MKTKSKRTGFSVPDLLVILLSLATLAGFAGKWWWLFDLFAHFRFHYLLIALITGGAAFYIKHHKTAFAAGILALINFIPLYPYYFAEQKKLSSNTTSFSLITFNLKVNNRHTEQVRNYIQKKDPDIILLQEYNAFWDSKLNGLESRYEYKRKTIRQDNFGLAVYSKIPLKSSAIHYPGKAPVPAIEALLKLKKRYLRIINMHAIPPAGKKYSRWRNSQFADFQWRFQSGNTPVVMGGDFNATPHSYYLKDLCSNLDLENARKGFGRKPTWPAWLPGFLRISIDHILISPEIKITRYETNPDLGSDMRPRS